MALPSGALSRKFGRSKFTVTECDIQATLVGLSTTTLGDGGRGQTLSTVIDDRHLLITLSLQLCEQRDGRLNTRQRVARALCVTIVHRPETHILQCSRLDIWTRFLLGGTQQLVGGAWTTNRQATIRLTKHSIRVKKPMSTALNHNRKTTNKKSEKERLFVVDVSLCGRQTSLSVSYYHKPKTRAAPNCHAIYYKRTAGQMVVRPQTAQNEPP